MLEPRVNYRRSSTSRAPDDIDDPSFSVAAPSLFPDFSLEIPL